MKKEPSLLTILGISVCLLAALYLSKNVTNKATYQGCINSLANALCKYQNAKYNKKDSNQPRVSEKVNPPIEIPQVNEISNTKQQSLPRFCFSNILEEVAAIAFLFAVVLLFLFVLRTL